MFSSVDLPAPLVPIMPIRFPEDVEKLISASPVFPFGKFPNADVLLGPEMKSTGEVMGRGKTFAAAYAKAGKARKKKRPAPSDGDEPAKHPNRHRNLGKFLHQKKSI